MTDTSPRITGGVDTHRDVHVVAALDKRGGQLGVERPGIARFVIQDISLRGIAFPPPMVRSLARQMAGASSDGAIPLKVDPAVSDIVVHPTGVVLYRNRRPPASAPR